MSPQNFPQKKLRIIFMGTPDFALSSFEALVQTEEVIALVTQPDRPKGRKRILTPPPLKVAALKKGLPVFQPERIRKSPDLIETLSQLAPDLIVVVAFGQILPASVLKIPLYGCINVHASLLSKYRGAGPIQWAIIRGESETGVTTMQMDQGMDTGPMLLKRSITIDPTETTASLSPKLSQLGSELLIETIVQLKAGALKAIPQNNAEATMAPLIKKEDGRLQWEMSASEIFNRWRGLFPWPGLTTSYQNARLKLTEITLGINEGRFGQPGELLKLSSAGLEIAAGEGSLVIKHLQAEGKRPMTPLEYAAGHPLEIGEILQNSHQTK